MPFCLAYEAQDLCVARPAEDDDLAAVALLIFLLDALLQLENYRAGGVDDFDVIAACDIVGLGRFTMGA